MRWRLHDLSAQSLPAYDHHSFYHCVIGAHWHLSFVVLGFFCSVEVFCCCCFLIFLIYKLKLNLVKTKLLHILVFISFGFLHIAYLAVRRTTFWIRFCLVLQLCRTTLRTISAHWSSQVIFFLSERNRLSLPNLCRSPGRIHWGTTENVMEKAFKGLQSFSTKRLTKRLCKWKVQSHDNSSALYSQTKEPGLSTSTIQMPAFNH